MTIASLPRLVGRQREVLYLPAHGHTVVLGTAGSGKTTLAILRSLYLSDPSTAHAGRTLLVTYVDAERTGRSTRIRKADRADLFDLYERYLERRRQAGKLYDFDDLAGAVLRELADDQSVRLYRHVVIDEGQDFSPEMLRSLAAAIPGNGSLTFFGDIAQQIYGHRMSWRNAGLSARRLWRFEENYRNTKQIARLALALAAMPQFPDDRDLVEPTAPRADGPRPVLSQQPDELRECELVASRAADLARTGTVAILLRTWEQGAALPKYLLSRATRLRRDLNVWPNGPGLFYGTYHASKGLEFDTVFMLFLSDECWPHPPDVEYLGPAEAAARDSRLLYVGITRARSTLVLTYTGQPTALLRTGAGLYQS